MNTGFTTTARFVSGHVMGTPSGVASGHSASTAGPEGMAPAGSPAIDPSAAIDWPQSILDELDHGILLLGPDLYLMLINRAAEAELGSDHPLMLVDRQLRARETADDAVLQQALEAATWRGLQRLLVLGAGSRRVSVRVVPLGPEGGAPAGRPGPRPVMLQLSRRRVCERLSVEWFARHHALTPAETRVLDRLCAGEAPRRIAEEQGVGLATVRTQVGSIRLKTGAASIRDLVQQVAMLPPMVGRLRS